MKGLMHHSLRPMQLGQGRRLLKRCCQISRRSPLCHRPCLQQALVQALAQIHAQVWQLCQLGQPHQARCLM